MRSEPPELDALNRQLEISAYHEAGHVVASWETDFPAIRSTARGGIDEDDHQDHFGFTEAPPDGDERVVQGDEQQTRRNLEGWLVYTLAGELSDSIWSREGLHKSDAEWLDAVAFAGKHNLPFSDAVCEALDLVLERWRSIAIVAEALKAEEVLSHTRLEELRVRCSATPERFRGRRWVNHRPKGGNA